MIYISILGFVVIGVIIACVLEYRKTKKKWTAYKKEVKYKFEE